MKTFANAAVWLLALQVCSVLCDMAAMDSPAGASSPAHGEPGHDHDAPGPADSHGPEDHSTATTDQGHVDDHVLLPDKSQPCYFEHDKCIVNPRYVGAQLGLPESFGSCVGFKGTANAGMGEGYDCGSASEDLTAMGCTDRTILHTMSGHAHNMIVCMPNFVGEPNAQPFWDAWDAAYIVCTEDMNKTAADCIDAYRTATLEELELAATVNDAPALLSAWNEHASSCVQATEEEACSTVSDVSYPAAPTVVSVEEASPDASSAPLTGLCVATLQATIGLAALLFVVLC
eukprot:TRINITY_DN4486_c0_g1_i5.p1 TRINITY_DN4486_c0_g1~~TRINITY_DN4486_c0_g1_i5.p1  ORF type:complete len:288 (-),score=32.43 TRINITY_DN4486_c0_g1_i5:685-1548(-)